MPSWTAARKREKERKRFGWDDLFDLLQTAASGYSAVAGIGEARKRTTLMQEQQAFNVQKKGMEAAESGRIGTWDEVPEEWQGPLPASQREVGGPMGRQQFTQTGTAQEEALRQERVGMLGAGWQPDIQGPLPEHYQRGEGYMRNPLADVEAERGFAEANPPVYDPSQPFTLVGTGHERTPGFVSDEEKALAAMRAGIGGGPSGADIGRFRSWAKDIADRYAYGEAHKGREGFLDPMSNNAPNEGHPEWQQVYNEALEGFMGGGADIEEEPVPDLLPNLVDLALGNVRGDPEDIAGLAGLRELEPGVAAVVDSMIAQIEAAGAGTTGGKIGGLFGMLGQGMGLAERAVALPGQAAESLTALPGRVQAVPGAISERAEDVSEAAWPLKALWQLLGR